MIQFAISIFFGLFMLFYIGMIAACIWQERELSLPHEKAVRMTTLILLLSSALFALALYSFLHIRWEDILTTLPS